jgi:hypothetical protein
MTHLWDFLPFWLQEGLLWFGFVNLVLSLIGYGIGLYQRFTRN